MAYWTSLLALNAAFSVGESQGTFTLMHSSDVHIAIFQLILQSWCKLQLDSGTWAISFFFKSSVEKVVKRKLDISSKALTTNQFVAHWHLGVVCQKGQLLHSQLVTSDLPSNRRPWVALAIQEHAYYMHAPPHVSLGEQHSILGKLCLLFSAMLDHLTCLCCYVTTASPLWTVRAEQPES